jgi:hypothetical protein
MPEEQQRRPGGVGGGHLPCQQEIDVIVDGALLPPRLVRRPCVRAARPVARIDERFPQRWEGQVASRPHGLVRDQVLVERHAIGPMDDVAQVAFGSRSCGDQAEQRLDSRQAVPQGVERGGEPDTDVPHRVTGRGVLAEGRPDEEFGDVGGQTQVVGHVTLDGWPEDQAYIVITHAPPHGKAIDEDSESVEHFEQPHLDRLSVLMKSPGGRRCRNSCRIQSIGQVYAFTRSRAQSQGSDLGLLQIYFPVEILAQPFAQRLQERGDRDGRVGGGDQLVALVAGCLREAAGSRVRVLAQQRGGRARAQDHAAQRRSSFFSSRDRSYRPRIFRAPS